MKRHPYLYFLLFVIFLSAGFGAGFMVACWQGAQIQPEVITKTRWVFKSTTTTTYNYMPPDDLSHLNNSGPCFEYEGRRSGDCPPITVPTIVVQTPPYWPDETSSPSATG